MPRPQHYSRDLEPHREEIFKLKIEGFTSKLIQEIFQVRGIILNLKSISSINSPQRKSPYRQFKLEAKNYVYNYLQQLINLNYLIENHNKNYKPRHKTELKTQIRIQVERLFLHTSHLSNLLPVNKKKSEKKRIKSDLKKDILELIINQHQTQNQQQPQQAQQQQHQVQNYFSYKNNNDFIYLECPFEDRQDDNFNSYEEVNIKLHKLETENYEGDIPKQFDDEFEVGQ